MTKRFYNRRHVMLVSHALTKVGYTQSEALRTAWFIEKSSIIRIRDIFKIIDCNEAEAAAISARCINELCLDNAKMITLWQPKSGDNIARIYVYGSKSKKNYVDISDIYYKEVLITATVTDGCLYNKNTSVIDRTVTFNVRDMSSPLEIFKDYYYSNAVICFDYDGDNYKIVVKGNKPARYYKNGFECLRLDYDKKIV